MMERKLFRTRLCVLYQRGRCNRPNCSFAHGEAELRRFDSSVPGRRDYQADDLRGRLGKRYRRRYSPERDRRNRQPFHGYSPSRSPEDNRKRRKKHHMDGRSDVSGDLKMPDGTEDHVRGRKSASSHSRYALKEQLKKVQSDIDHLDDHKSQLGIYMEERVQEADTLASKITELESQLYKEKKECKRINSRIKKFVRAHHRYFRLQDEVKRSQRQLHNLGEQLGLDAIGVSNKEDSSINIVSDGEAPDNHFGSTRDEQLIPDSLKVAQFDQAGPEEPPPGKLKKLSRWGGYPQMTHDKEADALNGRKNISSSSGEGSKQKRDMNASSANKNVQSRGGLVLATQAVDVFVDIEDENAEVAEAAPMKNTEAVAFQNKVLTFLIPPPPPVRKSNYAKYAGEDEDVDIDSPGKKKVPDTVNIAS